MDKRKKILLVLILSTICVLFWNNKVILRITQSGLSTNLSQGSQRDGTENITTWAHNQLRTPTSKQVHTISFTYPGANVSFNNNLELITSLGLPPNNFITVTKDNARNFTFVTASSADHFKESLDMVGSVQTHFPGYTLYYYDIGLRANQVAEVKRLCNVIYRKFNWSKYKGKVPSSPLFFSGWKALSLQEVLVDHQAVFWVDASMRFYSSLPDTMYAQIERNGGMLLFHKVPHSNFAVTHPSMYKYIPTNTSIQKTLAQIESGGMLIYQTEDMFYNVMWWFYLCSMEVNCISPTKARGLTCPRTNWWKQFCTAHRFDQSAINLLLSNHHSYNDSMYYHDMVPTFEYIRGATNKYTSKICRR